MEKRTYATSDQTKHALASALKELMAQKPIDKITIHDITERCGIRRQNFYYHFEDVYDLMRWMFQEEAVSLLRQHEGTLLWQEGLLQLFRYIEENKAVCLCALRSVGREHLKRFFETDIHAIIHRTVEQFGHEVGGHQCRRYRGGYRVDHAFLCSGPDRYAGELAAGRDRPHAGGTDLLCRPHPDGSGAGCQTAVQQKRTMTKRSLWPSGPKAPLFSRIIQEGDNHADDPHY